MAKSRFEYVKSYELPDPLMPNAYIIVRVDGRGFHKFSDVQEFEKPNDRRALDLMNRAAKAVMDEFEEVVLGFGESDEFSHPRHSVFCNDGRQLPALFLMRRQAGVYGRRRSKINSAICSVFTSAYVFYWPEYFPNDRLRYLPTFDSRVVLYPGEKEIRDYFAWRQADTHINNMYNTCFWALVKAGRTPREANKELQGTNSKDKNEMLFSEFGINYNDIDPFYRKGSVLVRVDPNSLPKAKCGISVPTADADSDAPSTPADTEGGEGEAELSVEEARRQRKLEKKAKKAEKYEGMTGPVVYLNDDIIKDAFWNERPWLLE